MMLRSICLPALTATLTAACGTAPETAGLSTEEEANIRLLIAQFADAERAGDWDAVLNMMTEDVVFLPNEQPAIEGRAALREWMAQFTDLTFEELNVRVETVVGRGDLAVVWGRYDESYMLDAMAEPLEEAGKFVWVLRKQADGSWRVAIAIVNSDPLPGGRAEEI